MKAAVQHALRGRPDIALEDIDISGDPVLLDRYGLEIPVLMIDGRKVAKYRVTEAELARMLDTRNDAR
jgi:hypothetical protein